MALSIFDLQAELCQTMSNATRLRIVHQLREGPACVGEIVSATGLAQAKVSQHLAVLRAHRIVACRGRRASAIVGAVAGDVDDAPRTLELCLWEQRHGVVDGAADRGAAAEQGSGRQVDGIGKGTHRDLVVDEHPGHHLHLQRRAGPLHHGHRDRAGRTRR